ncbi:MAG: RNA polymerase subunit sigma-70, partial [Clostridia bacterium]|nr:RNA polymerase subunit sigma-70 [Clostridia bacterium]
MDDRQIVDLYLARDESAISATQQTYGIRLRALALGIVEDMSTAEECENDTYYAAWQSIPPHKPWDYLYPFLARITRHAALDHCRKQQSKKRSADLIEFGDELSACLPSADGAEETFDAKLLAAAVSAFLRTEPQINRILFVRRCFHLEPIPV